ncbi:MAG: HAD family hydrolase [Clostridiales bacterium]|nr:HAD family hydrolase [Clostridiales bacterium]
MKVKAVIFDLDGTLLNTLDDLAASVNAALAQHDLPVRTLDEVRAFVGNGVRNLIIRAMPEKGEAHPMFQQVLDAFIAHYAVHSKDMTRPYDGIMDALDALLEKGAKLAIVSNKIDFAVKELSSLYFGKRMLAAIGDDPSRARKPAPDSVFAAMEILGVGADEAVYVGDSDVDVFTAHNAGLPCLAVSWGFRSEESLKTAGAEYIAHTPKEMLKIIDEMK